MRKKLYLIFVIFIALSLVSPQARAASSLQEPGADVNDVKPKKDQPQILQEDTVSLGNSEQKFMIGSISLESKDIELEDYSDIIAKYANREVSMNELNELAQTLTKKIRECGYPAAAIYIPKQKFNQGDTLVLGVEPGRYGKITIDNKSGMPESVAKGYLANIKPGDIIKSIPLESAMNKFTRWGGVNAAAMLSAGEAEGTTDLTVTVRKGKIATEIVYADNYGTESAGRYRYALQGDVQFPTIGGALNYFLSLSNGGQHNYNLGYSQFVGRSSTRLGLNISRSDYELGGVYKAAGVQGEAYTIGVNGNTPLFSSWHDSLDLNYGFNYRKLEDEQKTFGLTMEKHSNSAYLGLSGTYRRGKGTLGYELVYTLGRLDFDNDWAKILYGASDTEGVFNKFNLNASYLQIFDQHFDVLFKVAGQLATSNLDGSEELVLGGINGVRAYPTGVGAGDEGFVANLEFRYHTPLPGLTLSAYLDAGHVEVTHDKNNFAAGTETAKGWGIGISYTKPGKYFVRLDYARRIGELSYYQNSDGAKDRGRIWFMLGMIF